MVKFNEYKLVDFDGLKYAVIKIQYNGVPIPIIIDANLIDKVVALNKSWRINNKGHIVTSHVYNNDGKESICEIYLHDVILTLHGSYQQKPVLHINRLGIDNRVINLSHDVKDKDISKNLKKKARSIKFPKHTNVKADDIPSFVWYIKEDPTHGERFSVEIGDIKWKTSSSKTLSLKYKLEEAKKFLRHLKSRRSDLFDSHSMNGDLNKHGKQNLESFYKIAFTAKYTHLNIIDLFDNTDEFLKQDLTGLDNEEVQILNNFDPNL